MDVTVAALMTAPRYECVQARNGIELALSKAGVPLTISGGVYYHQCMESMLEDVVGKGIDYALTVDFDSVFTADHVTRLISIVSQEEKIDALAAIQPMRGKGRVLGSVSKESSVQWNGYPIQVDTAHFGLTVIDLKKLAEVPQPWFLSTPDSDGRWGDGCIDADVSFWRKWQDAGCSVYLDPGARLGHLEEMVTVFDREMNKQHVYYSEWSANSQHTVDQ